MIIDSRKLPLDDIVETDVCIVGAGPAGITIAREFIDQDFRVTLMEGGNLLHDEEMASLVTGETAGDKFPPLNEMRHRQFGGMANLWYIEIWRKMYGLRHMPFDAIDFEKRDWVPYSGWPFDRHHLISYYHRAQQICRLGPFDYDPGHWQTSEYGPTHFDDDLLTTGMFQFGPRDVFIDEYRHQINKAENITVYLNANAVEMERDEGGNVRRAYVRCLSGNAFSVKAKIFVLAAGAIENARLLLQSERRQPNGWGNEHDVVGRYFIDHATVNSGTLVPQSRDQFRTMAMYDLRHVNNIPVMAKYALSEAVMRREKLFNMSAILFARTDSPVASVTSSRATASARTLLSGLRKGSMPRHALHHLANVATHIDDVVRDYYRFNIKEQQRPFDLSHGGWSESSARKTKFTAFQVVSQTEQTPDPDNRVTLGEGLDPLGYLQPKLTFRWNERDIDSIKRSQVLFAKAFANAGVGKLNFEWRDDRPIVNAMSTHHNMGTTRMHSDPRWGVVDANCKVHGLHNLFIAGGSVIPTGGYANPTLTIVALAARLADHIKARMTTRIPSHVMTTSLFFRRRQ